MAFGLCNAGACFERLMICVLAGLNWQTYLLYLDDVIIFAATFDEHLKRENHLAPLSASKQSSIRGSGYESFFVMLFNFRKSTQNLTVPSFVGTKTMRDAHGLLLGSIMSLSSIL
jgi:hypothetical protein